MLYRNFTRLTFPKMCIFPNTKIYFDGGNRQFMINFFGLVRSDTIYKTDVGENMQLYVTVPPLNYWSLCATRDDCICMQILNCAIVL